MIIQGAAHAENFADMLVEHIQANRLSQSLEMITPVIQDKNPFCLLDRVGRCISPCKSQHLFPFLYQIADTHAEGSWVLIITALHYHPHAARSVRLEITKQCIIQADVWYGADIFGERVHGPFLLMDLTTTLDHLEIWISHPDAWVRRTLGVAVHFWAKRTRGSQEGQEEVGQLLAFISPLFEEQDMRAAKGIGWGLKTLGRYYPHATTDLLRDQLHTLHRQPKAVMRRKALTYLPHELKADLSP